MVFGTKTYSRQRTRWPVKLITFNQSIERFSVSNPDIAEAVLVSGNQVIVNGKAFGQINFIAWEKGTDRFLVFDVYVRKPVTHRFTSACSVSER